jgi:hypothetical protein
VAARTAAAGPVTCRDAGGRACGAGAVMSAGPRTGTAAYQCLVALARVFLSRLGWW